MNRCKKYDLPADMCAHCRGNTRGEADWTTTSPIPLPRAIPVDIDAEPPLPLVNRGGLLGEVETLYHRLFRELPSGASKIDDLGLRGKSDKRRAPLRIDVLDFIAHIDVEIPTLAASVCDALGDSRCPMPTGSGIEGQVGPSPKTLAALDNLSRHWTELGNVMPTYADEVKTWLGDIVAKAKRMVGEVAPPSPLASPCPSCHLPTVFRIETERGVIAVCANRADLDQYGRKRQWNETEWEDATQSRRSVYQR